MGNEDYGSWEYDLHPKPHDPATYSAAVKTGYYPAVKAADPQAKLGVVADFAQPYASAWNDVVFRQSGPFDFVEIHYYPQYNVDSDSYLLGPAIDTFASDLANLRFEMTADGLPKALPIYLGEYNNDAGQEGKQSVSIVNGLFAGQMLGTAIQGGVSMSTFWLAYGSCDEKGDYSKKLYGWQHFGTEALFSDGLPDKYEGCATTPHIAGGTPFPTARIMALMAQTIPAGSSVRTVTVPHSLGTTVRAFGFATGSGYELALFNNTLQSLNIDAEVRKASKGSYDAAVYTYGKPQYDFSKNNRWIGPVSKHLGIVPANNLPLLLPPYSLTILVLK